MAANPRPALAAALLLAGAACATTATTAGTHRPAPLRESVATASIHGQRLELHVAVPAAPARPDLLVVYASGDGGWFGAAVDQWREIARAGYATAGFSARSFLRIDRPAGSRLDPARLASEYQVIVQEAERALGRPGTTPVILAGWSRGAAFSVLVGNESVFRDTLAGVLAFGLAEGEDLLVNGDADDTDDGARGVNGRELPFDTYGQLLHLPVKCAVIQATRDNYFPAAEARTHFGQDTPVRRLYAIDARNHRFSGGAAAFTAALIDALRWLSSTPAGNATPSS